MKKRILMIISMVLIIAMFTLIFSACIPSKYENAEKKLEKEGYSIIASGGEDSLAAKGISKTLRALNDEMKGTVKGYVSAINNDGYACEIYYFSKVSDANYFYKKWKDNADEDYVVKKLGKAVFKGDKQAWKDL